MTNTTDRGNKPQPSLLSVIINAGLLAGTLDICSAFLYYYIKTRKNPLNVLIYISKLALKTVVMIQEIAGLLIHYCIAFGWTILFFMLYPRLKWLQKNIFMTAIIYGVFVWAMMNIVIVPLWTGKAFAYKRESSIVNCIILVLAIGTPLSFMAHHYYSKKTGQ